MCRRLFHSQSQEYTTRRYNNNNNGDGDGNDSDDDNEKRIGWK